MFDIEAAKRKLGIEHEEVDFKSSCCANRAKSANPEPKISTISTISTSPGSETGISEVQNRLEAAEERAAIMEYDGGLSRTDAECHAIETHLKSYYFQTTDGQGTFLARYQTLEDAKAALLERFGKKLLDVKQSH